MRETPQGFQDNEGGEAALEAWELRRRRFLRALEILDWITRQTDTGGYQQPASVTLYEDGSATFHLPISRAERLGGDGREAMSQMVGSARWWDTDNGWDLTVCGMNLGDQ